MRPPRSYDTILEDARARAQKGKEAIKADIDAGKAAAAKAIEEVHKGEKTDIEAIKLQQANEKPKLKQEKAQVNDTLKARKSEADKINKKTTKGILKKEKVPLTKEYNDRLKEIEKEIAELERRKQGLKDKEDSYNSKIEAIKTKAKLDIEKINADFNAQKDRLEGDFDIVLPHIYEVIHLGMKVGESLKAILTNPWDTIKAGKAGLKLVDLLEKDIGGKVGKDKINEIITSDTVKSLLADPDLWQVIEEHSTAIPDIVESRKEMLGEAIRKELEGRIASMNVVPGVAAVKGAKSNTSITTATRLHAAAVVFSNPDAIAAIIKITSEKPTQQALANLFSAPPVGSKTLATFLASQGINVKAIQSILPSILDLVRIIGPNNQVLVDILKVVGPSIADPTIPLDINAVLPHAGALLFGNNGIASDIGNLLANNKDALLKLGEVAITSQTNMLKLARFIKTNRAAILELVTLVNANTIDEKIAHVAGQAQLDPVFLESMISKFKSNQGAIDALGNDKTIAVLENRVELIKRALVLGQDILPIVGKVMQKNNNPHFNKIMGVLPELMAVYKPKPELSEDDNKKAAAAFNAAKRPIIMGLIPDLMDMFFGPDTGIATDLAKILEKDHNLIVQMAKYAEASQTGATKFAVMLEDILPIAANVMKNKDAIGKITGALPDLIKVYSPNPDLSEDDNKKAAAAFNAAKMPIIIKLFPDLREMLFAPDKGIAGNLVSMLATKKDVLMELGKTVQANQTKKMATLTDPKQTEAIDAQIKTTAKLLGMADAVLPLLSKNLLPGMLPIVDKVLQNDKIVSGIMTILPTVTASGKPDPAALKELIKPVKELLFDKGIASDLASMLAKEQASIVQMAGLAEAYQTGTTKFAVLLEDVLPIAAKVMRKQDALVRIMDAMPELMAVYQPNAQQDEATNKAAAARFNAAKTQKIGAIFPDLQNLLLGDQGIIKDLEKMLVNRQGVLLELGKAVKANQEKKLTTLSDTKKIEALRAQIKRTDMLLGMADTLLPLVANNLLPVADKVMVQHNKEITQIIAALPAVIASSKPDPVALQGLIAPVKQLLFGEQGITDEIVNGIDSNKGALVNLISSRILNSPGVQRVLQGISTPPAKEGEKVVAAPVNEGEAVAAAPANEDVAVAETPANKGEKVAAAPTKVIEVPKPLIANALNLATTFLKHNKDGLGNILEIVQRVKINEKGRPEITRMQMGDIAWELRKALRDEDIIKILEGFLNLENIQFLGKLPQLEKFNLAANAALIQDAGKRAINILPVVSHFMQNNFGIIHKILQEQDNLANGVFKDTSITPDELVTIARTGLLTLMQFDPAGILSAHKEEASSLIQAVAANALGGIAEPGLLAKIVVDSAAILLKPDVLRDLLDKVDNIALIIDDKTPRKEKLDKVFELTDIFVKQLKTNEFQDLYKNAAIPLIEANKVKIAEFFTKEASKNKIKLDGNKAVRILENPKTLKTFMEAYEAYKQHSTLKAMGKGIKAFFQSKDLRSIVYGIVISKIKDRTYPNFIRRWSVGSKINKIIHEAKPQVEVKPEGPDASKPKAPEIVNLAAKLAEKSTGTVGIYNSTLHSKTCKGLDFGQLKFDNFEIKGFNFKDASFGSKKAGVDFSGSNISKTNFEGCTLRGKNINLSNTTIDFRSFQSLLPALNKAVRSKVVFDVKGMKIDVSKCSVKEMEEFERMKTSRFGKAFLTVNTAIKLVTTKEHDVKDIIVEKTKAEVIKAAMAKGNPPSLQ